MTPVLFHQTVSVVSPDEPSSSELVPSVLLMVAVGQFVDGAVDEPEHVALHEPSFEMASVLENCGVPHDEENAYERMTRDDADDIQRCAVLVVRTIARYRVYPNDKPLAESCAQQTIACSQLGRYENFVIDMDRHEPLSSRAPNDGPYVRGVEKSVDCKASALHRLEYSNECEACWLDALHECD